MSHDSQWWAWFSIPAVYREWLGAPVGSLILEQVWQQISENSSWGPESVKLPVFRGLLGYFHHSHGVWEVVKWLKENQETVNGQPRHKEYKGNRMGSRCQPSRPVEWNQNLFFFFLKSLSSHFDKKKWKHIVLIRSVNSQ